MVAVARVAEELVEVAKGAVAREMETRVVYLGAEAACWEPQLELLVAYCGHGARRGEWPPKHLSTLNSLARARLTSPTI